MRLNHLQILTVVALFIVLLTYKSYAAGNGANFDGRLEASTADILFHTRDAAHANRILGIFEQATQLVSQWLPHSGGKITIYLYGSSDELAQGLRTTLGYNPMEVKAVLRVGISEQSNNTLHLHPKTLGWGDYLSHAIVDEHTHGVIQNKYGTRPAKSATWIEEGLTSYLAHDVLTDKLKDFEDAFPERQFKVAFKALIFGKLPKLADISTRVQWYSNINESREAWSVQYALAYFGVSYLVANFGFESVLNILSDLKNGISYIDALESETGVSMDDFEHSMRLSLLYNGFFDLYMRYTVLIVIGLTITFSVAFYSARLISRRNRMEADT